MHMIRHDHPRLMLHPLSLKAHQTVFQHLSSIRIGKQTTTHSPIKPSLDRTAEFPMIFRPDFVSPWLGMIHKPFRPLVRPVLQQGLRQRISKPECDKLHHFSLLPVGQGITTLADFAIRIKEAHLNSCPKPDWYRQASKYKGTKCPRHPADGTSALPHPKNSICASSFGSSKRTPTPNNLTARLFPRFQASVRSSSNTA